MSEALGHTVEALIPSVYYDTGGQPPPGGAVDGGAAHLASAAASQSMAVGMVQRDAGPAQRLAAHHPGNDAGGPTNGALRPQQPLQRLQQPQQQQQPQRPQPPYPRSFPEQQQHQQQQRPGFPSQHPRSQPHPQYAQSGGAAAATAAVAVASGFGAEHTSAGGGGERPWGYPGAGPDPDPDPGPPDPPVSEGGRSAELAAEMRSCRSCRSLQRFVAVHRPNLSRRLLGAAVVHLSQLVAAEPPDDDPLERQLLAGLIDDLVRRLRGGLTQFPMPELAALVCALSKLNAFDGPLLREAAAQAEARAAELSVWQAAGLVWSFGRFRRDFRISLQAGWALTLLDAVRPRIATALSSDVVVLLYGIAVLDERPSDAALGELLDALLAGMPSLGGRELAMSIWALARLAHDPGQEWLAAFLARCEAATRTFDAGGTVAMVFYSLARLGVRPPAAWMVHFLWQAQRRMNAMDGQSLTMLVWALGTIRYRPDKKWLTHFLRYCRSTALQRPGRDPKSTLGRSSQALAEAPPAAGVRLAATQRQTQVWRLQQERLRQRLAQQGGRVTPVPAPAAPAATAAMPAAPTPAAGVGAAPLPAVAPKGYIHILWALRRLWVRPNGTWLLHLCISIQPRLTFMSPLDLATLLWFIARLSWRPQQEFLADALAALRAGLPHCPPAGRVMAFMAFGRFCGNMDYRPGGDVDVFEALALSVEPLYGRLHTNTLITSIIMATRYRPVLPPARLAAALAALLDRLLAGRPPPADAADAADASGGGGGGGDHAAQLTPRQCANAVMAVGCAVRAAGRSETVRRLAAPLLSGLLQQAEAAAREGALNGVDYLQLLRGVEAARVRIAGQWLCRHESRVLAVLEAGVLRPFHLQEFHTLYRKLGHQPTALPPPPPPETPPKPQLTPKAMAKKRAAAAAAAALVDEAAVRAAEAEAALAAVLATAGAAAESEAGAGAGTPVVARAPAVVAGPPVKAVTQLPGRHPAGRRHSGRHPMGRPPTGRGNR